VINLKNIKCPYCEWEWKEPIESAYSEGEVVIVRGNKRHLKTETSEGKSVSTHKRLVDIRCPKCKRTLEYNLDRNEVN
jgi:hypothetical protein